MDVSKLELNWVEGHDHQGNKTWTAVTPNRKYTLKITANLYSRKGTTYRGVITHANRGNIDHGDGYKTHITAMRGLVRRLAKY
jgi:hypothetical protein